MKKFILVSALIAATATGAVAQTAAVALSSAIQAQILAWVPEADLGSLTTMQYAQIVSLFATSDNLRAGNDPSGQVKVILGVQ